MNVDVAGVDRLGLQHELEIMTSRDNDRPRSLSSRADSELCSVHESEGNDGNYQYHDQRRRFDDTTATSNSLVPTGIQLERYTDDYSLHTDYLARYRSGAVTEGIYSTAQPFGPPHSPSPGELPETLGVPPTGTLWTDEEKQRLFGSLARRSRWRPDLIALDIKTKSESQVGWYLDALRLMSDMERARRPDRLVQESSIWREGYAPVAREVSASWVEKEETLARALLYQQAEELVLGQTRAEDKELQRALQPLASLKVYKEVQGPDSLLNKTLLRKTDYADRVEQADLILSQQEQIDVRRFLSSLTRRRLEHISTGLSRMNEDEYPEQPLGLAEDGTVPLDLYQEIEAGWKEDESRLAVLKCAGKDWWTVEESIEVESLRKKVSARKKEIREFEERLVRAEDSEVEQETGDVEEGNVVDDVDDNELNTEAQGRKRKRRQKKAKKETLPDGVASDEEAGENTQRSAKKVKLDSGHSQDGVGMNSASAGEDSKTGTKPRTIKPRSHLFTRNEARTTLKQLKSDLETKLRLRKEKRAVEMKQLDNNGAARLAGKKKRKEEGMSSVLDAAVAEFKEKKLDTFNLDNFISMPNGDRGKGIASSISISILELLYTHLDLFLRRLVMRIIYIGEGYAADRPGTDDELRLEVNEQLVCTAMDQIGLGTMISAKKNKFRHLEPFSVRHMLPTLPRNDGEEGTKWADDVVPNVAKGIIDPAYGRAIPSNGPAHADEDDGLITNEEDEIQDEMCQRLEIIQDELDTLYDVETETHLYARYASGQPKEASEKPWFGDRFDWTTYETEKVYLAHLKKNWLIDDGRRDPAKRSGSKKAKQEELEGEEQAGDEKVENDTDHAESLNGNDTEMTDLDTSDEESMMESSQFQRSSKIARLEKERSALTKDIRRRVYREAKRRNLPDRRPVQSGPIKRRPSIKGKGVKTFKSNDMVEDTSSEEYDEKGEDDPDNGDDEDESENEKNGDPRRIADDDNDGSDRDSNPNDDHDDDLNDNYDRNDDIPTAANNALAVSSTPHVVSPTQLSLHSAQGHTSQRFEEDFASATSQRLDSSVRSRARIDMDSDPDRTDSE